MPTGENNPPTWWRTPPHKPPPTPKINRMDVLVLVAQAAIRYERETPDCTVKDILDFCFAAFRLFGVDFNMTYPEFRDFPGNRRLEI